VKPDGKKVCKLIALIVGPGVIKVGYKQIFAGAIARSYAIDNQRILNKEPQARPIPESWVLPLGI
jgi:hypothetical protein